MAAVTCHVREDTLERFQRTCPFLLIDHVLQNALEAAISLWDEMAGIDAYMAAGRRGSLDQSSSWRPRRAAELPCTCGFEERCPRHDGRHG